jgi:phasin family protein
MVIVAVRNGLFKATPPRRSQALRRRNSRSRLEELSPETKPGDSMSTDPMQKFGKEGMDMAVTAFNVWTKNAQAIATEVADYSKKSFEDSAAAFQKLVSAKSLEKAVEVQTEYLRSSCEGLVAETAKLGELYAGMAREAYKPFEGALWKAPLAK